VSDAAARTVLHVFATFGRGGPEIRAAQLMARWGGGLRHEVVAMDGCTDASDQVPGGVDFRLRPPPPRRGFLRNAAAMGRVLAEVRPDLVLTYNWGSIETVFAARRAGFRARVHHEDGFGPEEAERRFRRRNWMRRWLLRSGAAVVVPSLLLRDIARGQWRLPDRLVHHLPNGVDLQRFHPAESRAGGPLVVGAVGGLRAVKDHATLLRAFALLRDRTCRLRLVGAGPLQKELQRLCDDLGIVRRVEFAGALPDPAGAYRDFDVFASSSCTEQMPLTLLEAMATGLPVAATDVGDVRQMLPATCRGALVPPRDPAALAVVLDALLADPARRQREGGANRLWCEQHYELGACLDRFLEVYRRALGG
jgi:glycosyltransferase involved in cell wall biosynthesis